MRAMALITQANNQGLGDDGAVRQDGPRLLPGHDRPGRRRPRHGRAQGPVVPPGRLLPDGPPRRRRRRGRLSAVGRAVRGAPGPRRPATPRWAGSWPPRSTTAGCCSRYRRPKDAAEAVGVRLPAGDRPPPGGRDPVHARRRGPGLARLVAARTGPGTSRRTAGPPRPRPPASQLVDFYRSRCPRLPERPGDRQAYAPAHVHDRRRVAPTTPPQRRNAEVMFELARLLDPDGPITLNDIAWALARRPDSPPDDLARALELVDQGRRGGPGRRRPLEHPGRRPLPAGRLEGRRRGPRGVGPAPAAAATPIDWLLPGHGPPPPGRPPSAPADGSRKPAAWAQEKAPDNEELKRFRSEAEALLEPGADELLIDASFRGPPRLSRLPGATDRPSWCGRRRPDRSRADVLSPRSTERMKSEMRQDFPPRSATDPDPGRGPGPTRSASASSPGAGWRPWPWSLGGRGPARARAGDRGRRADPRPVPPPALAGVVGGLRPRRPGPRRGPVRRVPGDPGPVPGPPPPDPGRLGATRSARSRSRPTARPWPRRAPAPT